MLYLKFLLIYNIMELITPNIGLLFWTTIIFLIVLIILKSFAWKPILNAIKTRENIINASLLAAEKARAEMAKLEANNERILKEAKAERDEMIREARALKESIISDARDKAMIEAGRIFEAARLSIEQERMSAIAQIKEQVAIFSLVIAEKILRKNLSNEKEHSEYISTLMNEIKLN